MKKKKVWISLGVSAVVIAMIVFYVLRGGTTDVGGDHYAEMDVLVQKVSEEELSETILVTGKIVPEDEQKVFLDMENGEISEFKVEENQEVKAGDPLFIYDTTKVEAEFNSAVRARDLVQLSLKAGQNRIEQLNSQIKQMKDALAKQQTEQKKAENDEELTIVEPPITKQDITQLEVEKAQAEIELENTKAEIANAQELINEIDKKKKEMTVVSKIDGIIVKVNKNIEPSETGMSQPVIHIVSSQPFKVIGTMSEFDAVKIKPDQAVIVRPKVYKDREWNGHVESVSQFPGDDDGSGDFGGNYSMGGGNVTMYPFKVAITDDTSELRQGFHVSLEVKVSSDEKSLVVPHMSVFDDMMLMGNQEEKESGMMDMFGGHGPMDSFGMASYVFVLVDGFIELRPVETGEMSDEFIEIVDGVSLGELVVITPHPGMYDGMEVTSYDEIE